MFVDHVENGFRLAQQRPTVKLPVTVDGNLANGFRLKVKVVAGPITVDEFRYFDARVGKEV